MRQPSSPHSRTSPKASKFRLHLCSKAISPESQGWTSFSHKKGSCHQIYQWNHHTPPSVVNNLCYTICQFWPKAQKYRNSILCAKQKSMLSWEKNATTRLNHITQEDLGDSSPPGLIKKIPNGGRNPVHWLEMKPEEDSLGSSQL